MNKTIPKISYDNVVVTTPRERSDSIQARLGARIRAARGIVTPLSDWSACFILPSSEDQLIDDIALDSASSGVAVLAARDFSSPTLNPGKLNVFFARGGHTRLEWRVGHGSAAFALRAMFRRQVSIIDWSVVTALWNDDILMRVSRMTA